MASLNIVTAYIDLLEKSGELQSQEKTWRLEKGKQNKTETEQTNKK